MVILCKSIIYIQCLSILFGSFASFSGQLWLDTDFNSDLSISESELVMIDEISKDKKSVLLQIDDMKPIMQMQIEYKIDTADGDYLSHRIQNTIHAIGNNGPFAKK